MAADKAELPGDWTMSWAALLGAAFLFAGLGAGWLIREAQNGFQRPAAAREDKPAVQSVADPRQVAGAEAAALFRKLQLDPGNADLLVSIGNLCYDAQDYAGAIDYYGRALALQPSRADVRTDMATAWWYRGDADRAIAELSRALLDKPDNPNTLFNLGIVRLQGKADAAGAIADWKKLLAVDPGYPGRSQVEQLISQTESSARH